MKKSLVKVLAMWLSACLLLAAAACVKEPDADSQTEASGSSSGSSALATTAAGAETTNSAGTTGTAAATAAGSSAGTKKPTTAKTDHSAATGKTTAATEFTPTVPKPSVTGGEMVQLALSAYQDLLDNWWTGNAKTGHLIATQNGLPADKMGFLWEHAMAIFALDSLYKATGYKEIRNRIVSEWAYIRACYPAYDAYVTVPEYFHTAQDDAGWNAMLYMLVYEYTGDTFALDAAGDLIRNTYAFWKNGDLSKGLLYDHDPSDETTRHSATHVASTMLAAFDYLKYRRDDTLKQNTITLYNWAEETFLRDGEYAYTLTNGQKKTGFCDDMLYWFNINMGRTGGRIFQGPEEAENPNRIDEGNSAVFLGGTMGMSVLHVRMYELTGDKKYRERAQRTVRAVFDNPYLVKNGVLVDAGDGWTNAAFVRQFVTEVLTLPGLQKKDIRILNDTANAIYGNARTADGYYSASWSGPAEDANTPWGKMGWTHDKLMTTATSIHMVIAAGLAESLGLG